MQRGVRLCLGRDLWIDSRGNDPSVTWKGKPPPIPLPCGSLSPLQAGLWFWISVRKCYMLLALSMLDQFLSPKQSPHTTAAWLCCAGRAAATSPWESCPSSETQLSLHDKDWFVQFQNGARCLLQKRWAKKKMIYWANCVGTKPWAVQVPLGRLCLWRVNALPVTGSHKVGARGRGVPLPWVGEWKAVPHWGHTMAAWVPDVPETGDSVVQSFSCHKMMLQRTPKASYSGKDLPYKCSECGLLQGSNNWSDFSEVDVEARVRIGFQ